MLTWNRSDVANFFGRAPVFHDNSSYTYAFTMLGRPASLRVYPYNGMIEIDVADGAVSWRLNCSSIHYEDDVPEEGGPSLAFRPRIETTDSERPAHWVVLGKSERDFEILTVFQNPDGDLKSKSH